MEQEEAEKIKHEMLKIATEIRKLQGKIGGLKAQYNKLKDKLDLES
jgi:predicted nuclease with TOPRIM domain